MYSVMAAPSSVYCVGCSIICKSSDRRSLTGAEPSVLSTWRELLMHELQNDPDTELDADQTISKLLQNPRLCRKCFSAFDRFSSLHKSITDNLKKVIEVIPCCSQTAGRKRPRLELCTGFPSSMASISSSTSTTSSHDVSPDVAVSHGV